MEPKIFLLYRIHVGEAHEITEELAGKYAFIDGTVHVLEDHFGVLERVKDQPNDGRTLRYLRSLESSPYYKVLDTDSLEYQLKNAPIDDGSDDITPPVASYEYVTNEGKHLVEFKNGKVFLDGTEIAPVEAQKLLEHNVKGVATIKFKE